MEFHSGAAEGWRSRGQVDIGWRECHAHCRGGERQWEEGKWAQGAPNNIGVGDSPVQRRAITAALKRLSLATTERQLLI